MSLKDRQHIDDIFDISAQWEGISISEIISKLHTDEIKKQVGQSIRQIINNPNAVVPGIRHSKIYGRDFLNKIARNYILKNVSNMTIILRNKGWNITEDVEKDLYYKYFLDYLWVAKSKALKYSKYKNVLGDINDFSDKHMLEKEILRTKSDTLGSRSIATGLHKGEIRKNELLYQLYTTNHTDKTEINKIRKKFISYHNNATKKDQLKNIFKRSKSFLKTRKSIFSNDRRDRLLEKHISKNELSIEEAKKQLYLLKRSLDNQKNYNGQVYDNEKFLSRNERIKHLEEYIKGYKMNEANDYINKQNELISRSIPRSMQDRIDKYDYYIDREDKTIFDKETTNIKNVEFDTLTNDIPRGIMGGTSSKGVVSYRYYNDFLKFREKKYGKTPKSPVAGKPPVSPSASTTTAPTSSTTGTGTSP